MDGPKIHVALGVALVAIVMCSTGAIVATYSQLSHTWDEGTHVAAGIELLQDGRYTFHTENPPLSRLVLAIIPYVNGARLPPPDRRGQGGVAGAELFYRTPDYVRNVTEARLGNLLFFWACVALTWILAGGRSDVWVAFLASAAVATLPPVIAHAGFATTDVAFVAAFLLALVALRRILMRPTLASAALGGLALGVAVATKFSTLVFLPPAAAAIVASCCWDRRRQWKSVLASRSLWRSVGLGAIVAGLVVWASYGFGVGRLADLSPRHGGNWLAFLREWRLPGHELIHGLLSLRAHVAGGHRATLFGRFSQHGFLLFYPAVLATKTPLPFLLFAVAGLVGMVRYRGSPRWPWFSGLALGAFGILLVSLNSSINLGVRHVLVIYPLVALAAAFGLARSAERAGRRALLGLGTACILLQLALLWSTVPNQITFYNTFAGSDPSHVSSDSDFDWGQDALALERYFAQHPVPELYILLTGTTKLCRLKLPPVKLLPLHPVSGWIAVSDRPYRLNRGLIRQELCPDPVTPAQVVEAPPGWLDWLKRYQPVAIIGRTVRLYHVPESR